MNLYHKFKDQLHDQKGVISDAESLLLNRKDYHLTQISPVNATLNLLGISVGYPYRVLISFLDQFASNLKSADFNVIVADPSLTLAAFYVWLRAGGNKIRGKVYAPKGISDFPRVDHLIGDLLTEFKEISDISPNGKPEKTRSPFFTFVLGSTKTGDQTIFAVDRFSEVDSGLLMLKDYAKINNFDEREYLENKLIFPAITFEGHAFSIKN